VTEPSPGTDTVASVAQSADEGVRFLSTNADTVEAPPARPYSAGMDSTQRTVQALRRKRRREAGQGMVEYAFIIVLIAIAVLVGLQVLGHATNNLYSNISNGLAA
jgi:Flp pilus assembly pilin Flp